MPANPLNKLLKPRLPACAVGIDAGVAAVVQLDKGREGFIVKRAASINLPPDLVRASFDESNIEDPEELTVAFAELLTSAGLLRQRKWSVTLPEASTRAAVMTLERAAGSRRELEEVLEWKIERSFGAPLTELRVAREQLPPDAQTQTRYLITAVRLSVLEEYEAVFAALGWQAGLILPRHTGEEQWLRNGHQGDGLLLTAHAEGFTAVLMRNNRPITLRSVFCEADECDDELHRVLLFYRERSGSNGQREGALVDRLLIIGDGLDKQRVATIAQETLGVDLKPLGAADVGLVIPGRDLAFDAIAAPAGLARLAW
jgi:Tfp pilus assembly PilM family ATPase